MRLWYKKDELSAAQAEAQRIIETVNLENGIFFKGSKVEVLMAWREGSLDPSLSSTSDIRQKGLEFCSKCYIPEAALLINGTVAKVDLLDLILLDLYSLQMKAILGRRKAGQ